MAEPTGNLTREEKFRILRKPLLFQCTVYAGKSWGGRSGNYDTVTVRNFRFRQSGTDESNVVEKERE